MAFEHLLTYPIPWIREITKLAIAQKINLIQIDLPNTFKTYFYLVFKIPLYATDKKYYPRYSISGYNLQTPTIYKKVSYFEQSKIIYFETTPENLLQYIQCELNNY